MKLFDKVEKVAAYGLLTLLLVAITAITRKIVILDASKMDPMSLFGIAAIVLALTGGYFFMRRGKQQG